eukprot:Amastigsp_a4412_375.p5 type:complete len:121 gc:universal Amastigsp_a4412_375:615-253(-)
MSSSSRCSPPTAPRPFSDASSARSRTRSGPLARRSRSCAFRSSSITSSARLALSRACRRSLRRRVPTGSSPRPPPASSARRLPRSSLRPQSGRTAACASAAVLSRTPSLPRPSPRPLARR